MSNTPTKDSIVRVLQSLTTETNENMLHGMAVGFMAGIALIKIDPLIATVLNRKLRVEWSLDNLNLQEYGPEEMAKTLAAALKEE